MQHVHIAILALGLTVGGSLSAQQTPKPAKSAHTTTDGQAALRAKAKISEDSARVIALAKVPKGTIKSSELEREHGKLIYSFDITVPGKSGIEEVTVNAMTGKLVSHTHETPAMEQKEAKAEAKERKHTVKRDSAHP